MTKAQQIREYFKQGLADLDVAQRVGCPEVYVRVVRARTDANGNHTRRPYDYNWRKTDKGRQYCNAYKRAWRAKRRAEARAS